MSFDPLTIKLATAVAEVVLTNNGRLMPERFGMNRSGTDTAGDGQRDIRCRDCTTNACVNTCNRTRSS